MSHVFGRFVRHGAVVRNLYADSNFPRLQLSESKVPTFFHRQFCSQKDDDDLMMATQLKRLTECPTLESQSAALEKVMHYTQQNGYEKFLHHSGLDTFTDLLTTQQTHKQVKRVLLTAFIGITANPVMAALFTQSKNNIEMMKQNLNNDDYRLQISSTLVLANLVMDPVNATKTCDEEMIEKTVELLAHSNQHVRGAAAYFFAIVGSNKSFNNVLNNLSAIESLSHLLSSNEADNIRSTAAYAIGNILSSGDIHSKEIVLQCGALPTLSLLLSMVHSHEINESAAWAIFHATANNVINQNLVRDAGGIGFLLKLLSSKYNNVRVNAIMALYETIRGNSRNIEYLKSQGNSLNILEELQMEEIDQCQKYATSILDSLANNQ